MTHGNIFTNYNQSREVYLYFDTILSKICGIFTEEYANTPNTASARHKGLYPFGVPSRPQTQVVQCYNFFFGPLPKLLIFL